MSRAVTKIVLSQEQGEGRGARVRRSIGRAELRNLDPFLMLDEFHVKPPAGFPDHPHRGFETVTYLFEGGVQHEDFCGHAGVIKPGGLQWMTAGRGIVHSEMPHGSEESYGLQLWVNLRAQEKMVEPSYQELEPKDIPVATQNGVTVKIIAGKSMGISSPVRTRTPTYYFDFMVKPGSYFNQEIPQSWTAFAYVIREHIHFVSGSQETQISPHHTVVFGDGQCVEFKNKGAASAHFVLIAGQPIGEPVVQQGPFVMNTREQIEQTFQDYQLGINGFENIRKWKSKHGNVA